MQINHQFRAFNTEVSFSLRGNKTSRRKLVDELESNARKFERTFSRFDAESELNTINRKSGKKVKVSDDMLQVLIKAKNAFSETKGIFDPSILNALQKAGYNRSFDLIRKVPDAKNPKKKNDDRTQPGSNKNITFNNLEIDIAHKTVSIPPSLHIDLGGIAKGYWVDKARNILEQHTQNYWLSAGGDLYLKGKPGNNTPWEIGIQNPMKHDADILKIKTGSNGTGIATSGITCRRGFNGKRSWHHIIDPRTGKPAKNSILSVTVIAGSTAEADVMAKTVLILGIRKGLAFINNLQYFECVIIDRNLKKHFSKGMKDYDVID